MSLRALCVTATMNLSLLSYAAAQEPVIVELDTSEGKVVLELDAEKAPKTVANFISYVKKGHYASTLFHRVIPDFMIQGGGFEMKAGGSGALLTEKPTDDPVQNEAGNGLKNVKYSVAMARTPDPHSATSQFFINTADNHRLNREQFPDGFGYTVFGRVVEGTDVVDKIGEVATKRSVPARLPDSRMMLMDDVPVKEIVIKSVKVTGGTK